MSPAFPISPTSSYPPRRRLRWRSAMIASIVCLCLIGCAGGELSNLELPVQPGGGGLAIQAGVPGSDLANTLHGAIAETDAISEQPEGQEVYQPPFADRKNPFEFSDEYATDGMSGEAKTDASSVRLYGFAGNESPRAIIHAGGRTRMLAAGERWGLIEVLEVNPPQAKIRVDGVSRNWSLLGSAASRDPSPDE